MLEAIRKRAGSFVVKILFVILVLSFFVWGIADVFRPGRSAEWAAEVGDRKISTQALQEEYRATLSRLGSSLGSRLDAEQARALGLPSSVLNRMVDGVLVDQAAADLGLTVSDQWVRNSIKNDPRFRSQGGAFDAEVFREALRRNGFTEERYIELLRRELQREQIVAGITGGAVPPRSLVESAERYRGERRTADWLKVSDAAITSIPNPDEPTVRQFYQDHAELFTAPELRSVTALVLSADAIAESLTVSEADLTTAYQERSSEFGEPERRTFRQVVFSDEAAAQRAAERLAQGGDLAAAAEAGGAAGEVSSIGPLARQQLPAELAAPIFNLAKGERSAPTRSPLGWHLIEVSDITPGKLASFAEVKDRLEAELKREKALDQLVEQGNKLEDTLGRGATLEEAAAELHLPLRAVPSLDPQGMTAAGEAVADLPSHFIETAFATPQGSESTLTEADRDTYFIVRVDSVTPSTAKPFESVRDLAAQGWLSQERTSRAKQQAEALAEKIRGGDFTRIAAEAHLEAKTTPPFVRSGEAAADVPRGMVGAMFAAKPGEVVVVPVEGGFLVARLTTILPAAPESASASEAGIRTELAESLRSDVLSQFSAALRGRYSVKVNPRALEQL